MLQLFVWDWNGTLFADTQAIVDAGNHIIREYGGQPLSRRQYVARFGFPVIDFLCNQGCDREALLNPGWIGMFHEFYEQRASRCHTRKGAREVLYQLKDQSVDSIILSNHVQEAITNQLLRLKLFECFGEVLANTELGATQSAIDKAKIMKDYFSCKKYAPADSFIASDSPEDIATGKTLGMRTIAITDGYYSTPRLRASSPDYLIGSLKEVTEIMRKG